MENRKYLFCYNLQYFAKEGAGGEKTEDATSKKIQDTRKEGQVAKSKDLETGISLLALFLTLKYLVGKLGVQFVDSFNAFYVKIPSLVKGDFEIIQSQNIIIEALKQTLFMMLPFLIIGFIVAFLGNKIQFKWMITTKPLQPKLNRMNPISGFKRIFSGRAVFELIKALVKIGIISYLAYVVVKANKELLFKLFDVSLQQAIIMLYQIVLDLGFKISIAMFLIGVADYAYQKWKHKEDIKMTKQEVKDEYKNSEGDPQVKGQQRQRMRQAAQRRMMANVPQADVVITNPTHFAVALKYDADVSAAPIVIAKGADFLAAKIKDIAKESKVEIVENKPLARMLYYNVDLDHEIPPELYMMVADILAYVYNLKRVS